MFLTTMNKDGLKLLLVLVWMWELDHKENWALKNGCFWTVVLEKTLESPLDCKEIQPIHPKGNQSWIFIGRTDAEATWCEELSWEKTLMLGKIEGRRRRGWQRMRWLDGITDNTHEFEQALEDGEGQGNQWAVVHWVAKSWTQLNHWT